nr:RHS repeat-associated core domain-containing protein [Neglectibacter timonensis]
MKLGYQYKYDAAGNIKEVYSRTGTNALALESSYEYDRLGQITKATDSRGTETYTYDTAGNLLSRALGGTGSTYTYGNSSWGDLLTAFKGQGIAYEGQTYSAASNTVSGTAVSGNPVSYYNGTRWAMDWKNGTQLSTASASGKNVSYIYDKDGLRTSKTVNGVTYEYAYAGGKLMWQGWSGNEIYFFYDNAGAPVALYYFPANGGERITGYYMTNQQGDIVRIENQYGTVIASYAYDAWGKPVSAAGSIADINPLRYRGYYYDTDTGFYYLQSRYYDPVVSRFISADSFASTGQGILGYNMFAYCNNDPVNYSDPSGDIAIVDDIIAIGLFFIATVVLAAIASSVVQFVQNITGSATSGSIAGSWNSASDIPKRDYAKEFEEQEKKIIASREKKSPILFPVNPMDFNPIGLERIPRVEMNQGKNGGIIHWVYPGTSVVIFEWNQDLNNTSHYHTMRPRDANHHNEGIHYLPGTPIPEPWRSMFFGG